MYAVICVVFAIVIFLIAMQVVTLKREWNKRLYGDTDNGFCADRYSDRINELGLDAMDAIEKGIVRKQLLSNDAREHDSNLVLDQYIAFVDHSSAYQYLISAKERKYNG